MGKRRWWWNGNKINKGRSWPNSKGNLKDKTRQSKEDIASALADYNWWSVYEKAFERTRQESTKTYIEKKTWWTIFSDSSIQVNGNNVKPQFTKEWQNHIWKHRQELKLLWGGNNEMIWVLLMYIIYNWEDSTKRSKPQWRRSNKTMRKQYSSTIWGKKITVNIVFKTNGEIYSASIDSFT